jgi:tryprostatin B 6-hydroxylase
MPGLAATCCYAAAAGVPAHLGYFIHGERHEEAPAIILLSIITPTLLFWVQFLYLQQSFAASALFTLSISSTFAVALWTSMVIYRLFFHPLYKFPGPIGARVSKFYHSYHSLPRFDGFRWLDRMHREYGDFVRTGQLSLVMLLLVQSSQANTHQDPTKLQYSNQLPYPSSLALAQDA